jgi:hypothetical protein
MFFKHLPWYIKFPHVLKTIKPWQFFVYIMAHSPRDVSLFGPFLAKPLLHLGVYFKFILVLKKTMDFP